MNLSEDEIRHLLSYARGKFETERYPFAPALRPVRDVLAMLRRLPTASVQCVVCSPPYLGLRDYGLPASVWGGEPA